MTDQEQRAEMISQTRITACTGCGRVDDQVVPGARCRSDRDHKWWTGTRREWFERPTYVFGRPVTGRKTDAAPGSARGD
jgi:hypothetical protein